MLLPRRNPATSSVTSNKAGGVIEGLLKLAQVVSILFAVAWSIWTYLAFQGQSEKLKIAQLQLGNEQIRMNLQGQNIDRVSKALGIRQQELQVKQSELMAENQINLGEVQLSQQEMALRISELTADTEVKRQELQARNLETDLKMKDIELGFNQAKTFNIKFNLDIECTDQENVYFAKAGFTITNTSKNNIELSWVTMHSYIGVQLDREISTPYVSVINPPPNPIFFEESEGDILWIAQSKQGWRYHDFYQVREIGDIILKSGGGGTNIIRPGLTQINQQNYFVHVSAGGEFAVVTNWGIDRATSGDGIYFNSDYSRVPNCNRK